VFTQNILIAAAIIGLTVAIFIVARRLLDRDYGRPQRQLAFAPTDEDSVFAPPPPTDLAMSMDRSFNGLVHRSGLGFTTAQTLGLFALTGLACAALGFFWRGEEWAAGVGLILGLVITFLFLWFLQARRQRLIQGQLPDAFYFMARSLRAGVSFEQTLARSGEQLEEPLAEEFRRCSAQIQLGLHPLQALRNTAARVELTDFDVFVSTVGLYYHGGGNLALLLDRLAASTRDRIQFLGYFRAATALARAAGFVLAAAAPVILIAYAVFQPDFSTELFRTAAGMQIIAIAAVLEVIGIIWMIYLLRVDY